MFCQGSLKRLEGCAGCEVNRCGCCWCFKSQREPAAFEPGSGTGSAAMAAVLLQVLGAFRTGVPGNGGGSRNAGSPGTTGNLRNNGNPSGSGDSANKPSYDPRSTVDTVKTGDFANIRNSGNSEDCRNVGDSRNNGDAGNTEDPCNAINLGKTAGPGEAEAEGPVSSVDPGIWDGSDMGGCLLLGTRSQAKTWLLFQAAAAVAGRDGGRVLLLAPRPVRALPAPLLQLEPPGLRRLQLVYPRSARQLLHAVASLHESPARPPALILLDGADEFLRGDRDVGGEAALLAALLRDTAAWANKRLSPSTQCQVIVTLQTLTQMENAADLGLQVLERYFSVKCMVNEQQCHVEGAQRYLASFSGLVKKEIGGVRVPQIEEDYTWELLFEGDNISGIHRVTREERKREVAQDR
ncbi:ATPase SWSAP1 [Hemitrygon akajei]|uniref:ATPase SWSAP1 n=1 Tax=Hemitrygon akajei TaxID=2704970 RepID=UPI003BF97DED